MANARTLFDNLTPRGRIVLVASALGILLAAFLLVKVASRPSYTLAMTGVDPAQTGKVTAALDAKGIGYELRNNGTAIAVDSKKSAQAQIALAEAGLNGAGRSHATFDLVTKQKLGASTFQQQVAYQQALEGSLASTIEQIQGVSSADVRLVLPQDQLFQDESTPATAAVLLGSSGTLDPAAVRGIAQLVANSVKDLKPSNVTISDATGQQLWPAGDGGAGGGGATPALAVEARYANQLETGIDAMLARTLGPDKAHVQVNADLNLDQATRDELTYAKKGVPLTRRTDTETLKGSGGGGATGTAGAGGNIPAYAGAAAGNGKSNYRHTTTDETLGVAKVVTRTKVAPGQVKRLSVALMVDKSVPPAQVAALKSAVSNAAGLIPGRGDTLSVSQVAFAKPPAAKTGPIPGGLVGSLKWALLGLASIAFVAFAARQIRRREQRVLGAKPVWLREIEAPRSLADLENEQPTEALRGDAKAVMARRQLDRLVREEPERVAAQMRTWMSEQ